MRRDNIPLNPEDYGGLRRAQGADESVISNERETTDLKALFGIFKGKETADAKTAAGIASARHGFEAVGKVLPKSAGEEIVDPAEYITVRLGCLIKRIPQEYLASGNHDPDMPVRFKAAELLMYVARRRPYVPLELIAKSLAGIVSSVPVNGGAAPVLFPWSEMGGQILDQLTKMEIGSEILSELTSQKSHASKEKKISQQLNAGATHWYSNSAQLTREKKSAGLRANPRVNTAPDDVPSQAAVSPEEASQTTPRAPEAPMAESAEVLPSPVETLPMDPAARIDVLIQERDEAVKQRELILAEFVLLEQALEEATQTIEASQDNTKNKAAMEALVRERDEAVRMRDEALAEIERVKHTLRHTTEALEAVCKTGLKDESAN